MKNFRLSTAASLLSLFVAGHALAEDASTNGIPTVLLKLYTSPTVIADNTSTNGIPTAILERYAGLTAIADNASTNGIPTAILEQYTSPTVSPQTKIATYFFELPGSLAVFSLKRINKNVRPELLELTTASTTPVQTGGENPLAEHVRAANDRFKDVAVAESEGYGPNPCASSPTGGAMGIHYGNAGYMKDNPINIARPQAVMYEPMPDGKLQLVAVEYISFKGPASLDGHLFNFVGAPNRYGLDPFYELHVWAWKDNPAGAFADNNPKVSCSAMKK